MAISRKKVDTCMFNEQVRGMDYWIGGGGYGNIHLLFPKPKNLFLIVDIFS